MGNTSFSQPQESPNLHNFKSLFPSSLKTWGFPGKINTWQSNLTDWGPFYIGPLTYFITILRYIYFTVKKPGQKALKNNKFPYTKKKYMQMNNKVLLVFYWGFVCLFLCFGLALLFCFCFLFCGFFGLFSFWFFVVCLFGGFFCNTGLLRLNFYYICCFSPKGIFKFRTAPT